MAEPTRLVDMDVFDQPERELVPIRGSFGSAVLMLEDACLSDTNGQAVILTADEHAALLAIPALLARRDADAPTVSDFALLRGIGERCYRGGRLVTARQRFTLGGAIKRILGALPATLDEGGKNG